MDYKQGESLNISNQKVLIIKQHKNNKIDISRTSFYQFSISINNVSE